MYKLLIFDWDGTVMDSAARIVACMQHAARDLQQPELTDAAIRDIIGLGLPEAFRILIPGIADDMIEPMRERYGYYFLGDDPTPVELFPGVREGLEKLQRQGFVLAVATGKSRRGIGKVFASTGLGDVFVASRGADETASKPDPLMIHEILAETGVAPEHALMIGDTEYDMEMAANAGVDGLAVSYGVHTLERMQPFKPVKEVHSFTEMVNWLESRYLEV
ncbi:HAD-IA family hydrolase [Amphritea spongicola]|nr:HAD-IA family hydrolase [Aliamphritea spongicola]MBN3561272.1 HAD-IA family hydrolase [Aliamphritea spongicola]